MRDIMRFVSTLFIWGMAGGIMLASVIATNNTGNAGILVPLVLFLSIAAAISTVGVWMGAQSHPGDDSLRSKGKRAPSRRVERLVAELDDDEIYDLEALLLARDDAAARNQRGR